jgi:Na+-driven multidrug efflux pump
MQSIQPKQHQLATSIKKLLLFSLPIIANSLLSVLPILASTWILSRLGKEQFAAAAIATPTFFTIATTFVTVFYAIGIKIGHCFGENKLHPEPVFPKQNVCNYFK